LRNFGELLVGIAQSRQLAALNQMLGDDYHTAGTVSVFPLFFGPSEARTAPGPPSTPAWDSEGPDFNAPGHIAGQGKMLRAEFFGERLDGLLDRWRRRSRSSPWRGIQGQGRGQGHGRLR
jgi:hypothetical protein